MKRTLNTAVLALIAAVLPLKAQNMTEPYTLTSLWKQYQEASKADRPQKEAEILTQIKQEATARHLPVDFYDAASQYVYSVQRRDWKQQSALRSALEQEVKAFDEPIVTFLWMNDWKNASTDELWAYVKAHPDGFKGCYRPLHKGVDGFLSGGLKPFIRTDREYVLWRMIQNRTYSSIKDDEIFQALAAEVDGQYPNQPALEFYQISSRYWPLAKENEEIAAYEQLSARYAGKAVSVFPKAELLRIRRDRLDRKNGPSDAYKTLCEDAQALEKERKAFKGDEATLVKGCTYPAELARTLTDQDINVRIVEGTVQVRLRNLPKADLTLRQGKKTVKSWKLDNRKNSFYVYDTLTVKLPVLPDGDYVVDARNGIIFDEAGYTQYTLSVATRTDSRGRCVYVADYKTGVPLRTATLLLMKGDKEVSRSTLKLDGFTPVPDAFDKMLDAAQRNVYYQLVAVSGNRKSNPVSVQRSFTPTRYDDRLRCNIYRDRGAYNPGDTVQFKAVVFNGDPAARLEAVEGKKLEVRLHDSEDNVIGTLNLTTNAWGSVSGKFVLPKDLRNGRFELEVVGLGYDWFRVDEFVLPSFELSFDPVKKLYMRGDDVPVSGVLKSYSGHNLEGVRLSAKVMHYNTVVLEQDVPVQPDNTFLFAFRAAESGHYAVELTATDPSGETRSFSQGRWIGEELEVSASVTDAADADLTLSADDNDQGYWRYSTPKYTVTTQTLKLLLRALDSNGNPVPLPVKYQVLKADDTVLTEGETPSGEQLALTLPGSGYYRVKASVETDRPDGKKVKADKTIRVICQLPEDRTLVKGVSRLFVAGPLTVAPGKAVEARLGSGEADAWTVVTLYGQDRQVLVTKPVRVQAGKMENLSFNYEESWPDAVRLQVFYFLDGKAINYERQYRREKDRYTLPLSFTRFQDKAYPGVEYSFSLKTAPGVEALAAAWDKSLDAIARNEWPTVHMRDFSVEHVSVSSSCGRVTGDSDDDYLYGQPQYMVRGVARSKSLGGANIVAMAAPEEAVLMDNAAVEEESIPFQMVEEKPSFGELEAVEARSEFSSALTFQPHLYPAEDGTLSLSFRTSDKLSTYYVRVYAHDKAMKNALVQQEMVVSLPVKVTLLEPRFMYEGDVYDAVVSVSSIADQAVSGTLFLLSGDKGQQIPVTVPAGETLSHTFRVVASAPGEMALKAGFKADEFTDAVQVSVPVSPAAQTLTESHSAVLHSGADREALIRELRSRFVNVPGDAATLKEITVLDMVRDAIPSHVEPSGNDVLSLSEAWYIRLMAGRLDGTAPDVSDLLRKVLSCRNGDGGFGWFEGMSSSPVITAVLLERFAKLRDRGFEVPDVTSSVKYLDNNQLGDVRPAWCGWLSDAQYLHVRALYAGVPFEVKPVGASAQKRMKEFTKWAKTYLTPAKGTDRGLKGQILAKSRRVQTLKNLLQRDGGVALAKAWGVSLGTKSKLEASVKADIASLLEYAVEHRDGGWYYPNAVMPWRGLLETEAYAHSLLCDLLWGTVQDGLTANYSDIEKARTVSYGIRIWLMLQKETQKWDTEPAFIDAITSILDGPEQVLDTRVLALSATYEAPFQDIKAAGNGFSVERRFFKEVTVEQVYDDKTSATNDRVTELQEIRPGDPVAVGDKIVIKYNIWNQENRSFVKVTAGREASLQPVQQLSGHIGYGFIVPRRSGLSFGFTPQGYRNVKASATEYFFDSYPEEHTTLTESFFVVRAGSFQAPVTVIESLYAPHYRANSSYRQPLVSSTPAASPTTVVSHTTVTSPTTVARK